MGGFIVLFGVSIVVVPMSVSWKQFWLANVVVAQKRTDLMKKGPKRLLRVFFGDEILPSYVRIIL